MINVLLVDDDELVLDVISDTLATNGIDCTAVTNPTDALGMVKGNDIAVIISDNRMPGMYGIDLLDEVRKSAPDTVMILLTGNADLETALDAIDKVGVFRVVVKPWDKDQLLAVVRKALQQFAFKRMLRSGEKTGIPALVEGLQLNDETNPHRRWFSNITAVTLGQTPPQGLMDSAAPPIPLSERSRSVLKRRTNDEDVPLPDRIRTVAETFASVTGLQTAELIDDEIEEILNTMKEQVRDADMADLLLALWRSAVIKPSGQKGGDKR